MNCDRDARVWIRLLFVNFQLTNLCAFGWRYDIPILVFTPCFKILIIQIIPQISNLSHFITFCQIILRSYLFISIFDTPNWFKIIKLTRLNEFYRFLSVLIFITRTSCIVGAKHMPYICIKEWSLLTRHVLPFSQTFFLTIFQISTFHADYPSTQYSIPCDHRLPLFLPYKSQTGINFSQRSFQASLPFASRCHTALSTTVNTVHGGIHATYFSNVSRHGQ